MAIDPLGNELLGLCSNYPGNARPRAMLSTRISYRFFTHYEEIVLNVLVFTKRRSFHHRIIYYFKRIELNL